MDNPGVPSYVSTLWRSMASYATTLMLVGSVCLNLVQARKLGVFESGEARPYAGTVAQTIHAKTLSGLPASIEFAGRPTVLYYFGPDCQWCERNWANVKALMSATAGRYRFVGLSTDANVRPYLEARGVHMEVYADVDADSRRAYALAGTPHTVVVSGDGRVARSWSGAFTAQLQPDVERLFGVRLPGLPAKDVHSLSGADTSSGRPVQ